MKKMSRSGFMRWLVPLILIWVAGMGLFQAWHQTLTSDEAIHTSSAYLAITRGEHRFDSEHPFLFKYFTALPFLVYHTNLPTNDQELWNAAEPTLYDSWLEARIWADRWVYESGNNVKAMQMLMRIPGITVMVLLCWFIWWLAKRWYDEKIALWALFFAAFNVSILAHGYMTNTDVPLAFTYLLAMWRMGEYGLKPTRANAGWVGLTIAIAMLTKFSALALIPAFFIWLVGVAVVRKVRWHHVILDALIVLAILYCLTWVVYFFHSPMHLLPGDVQSAQNGLAKLYGGRQVTSVETFLYVLPKILPSAYLKGLLMTLGGGLSGRPTFILGHTYGAGVWFYFPALFLLKNQLITIFLGAVALGMAIPRMLKPKQWSTYTWVFTVVGGIFLILALKSKLNLGIRHIMPLMPIFSIILAAVVVRFNSLFRQPYLIGAIILAAVLPVLVQGGNLLGFGNVLAGAPQDRSHYFVDSNLDWGQSWERIATVLKTEFPNQPVYVKYYASQIRYFAPDNPQYSITNAGAEGPGAILVAAVDLRDDLSTYEKYQPTFVVDNAYFIYKSDQLVPR
jgi:4-amino-4-deoxy-L-arabinose transferase-like glycosyltransferase